MTDPADGVPDWTDWDAASAWVCEGLRNVAALPRACGDEGRFESTLPSPVEGKRFGQYQDAGWRRAVLAVFLADLASYPAGADQVSFARLALAMHVFPRGFRTWWTRDGQGRAWPAGYAAWHPVSPATFSLLANASPCLRNRVVAPQPLGPGERPYVYVFNYSVALPLRRTALSRALVKTLAADLAAAEPEGLAAIVVSEDGRRVAERLGMKRTGELRSGKYAYASGV